MENNQKYDDILPTPLASSNDKTFDPFSNSNTTTTLAAAAAPNNDADADTTTHKDTTLCVPWLKVLIYICVCITIIWLHKNSQSYL